MRGIVCLLALLAGGLLAASLLPENVQMIQREQSLAEVSRPAPEEASSSSPGETSSSSPGETSSSSPGEVPPSSSEEAPVAEPSEPAPPPPKERVLPPVEEGEWMLRLVNWANPLPMDFAPEYEEVQNRFVLDKRIAAVARQMIADAQAEGVILVVNSAYRPYYSQQLVYDNRFQAYLEQGKSEEEARYLTDSFVAAPGCSEHQLGLAMDIVAAGKDEVSQGWLAANAPDYGFILRYPKDKTHITHTAYESWHYRYVGVAAAREITAQGLCLEEYLADRPG